MPTTLTNMSKTFAARIAESEERIARYSQLVADASTGPENSATLALAAKALESERAHKLALQDMLANNQKTTRRIAAINLRARIIFVLAIALVIAILWLDHGAKH